MGGKSGSDGDTTTTVRYAKYIEDAHKALITSSQTEGDAIMDSSPYGDYTIEDPDASFFTAAYTISSFPSLYDMFGKFMAGLDIEVLWNQEHSDSAYGAVINEIVAADSALLEDELDSQVAQMKAGMRDINAVMATGFMITEGNMRDTKLKAVAKERGDLRGKFTEIGQRRWDQHLSWNSNVIRTYNDMNKQYWATRFDYVNMKSELDTADLLWPFTVLDHQRVIVACLQGATNSTVKGKGDSKAQRAISGVLGGAAMGAQVGSAIPGVGTLAGTIGGGLIGLAGSIF